MYQSCSSSFCHNLRNQEIPFNHHEFGSKLAILAQVRLEFKTYMLFGYTGSKDILVLTISYDLESAVGKNRGKLSQLS